MGGAQGPFNPTIYGRAAFLRVAGRHASAEFIVRKAGPAARRDELYDIAGSTSDDASFRRRD